MHRAQNLNGLARAYNDQIVPKHHQVVLTTHVTLILISRDFILNDQKE